MLSLPEVRQTNEYDCGPACLRAVMQFYGITPGELPVPTEDEGTSIGQLCQSLTTHGLAYYGRTYRTVDGLSAVSPSLCPIQYDDRGHWVLVCGYDVAHVYLMNPHVGHHKMPRDEFEDSWVDSTADGILVPKFALTVYKH